MTGFTRGMLSVPGAELSLLKWEPPGPPRARVLLTHGHGEYASRYTHVAEAFVEAGFSFYAYDLRGHGQSSGRRGDVRCYADMVTDLIAVRKHLGDGNWFHYGHSLGAQILLRTVLENAFAVRGLLLSSPWLGLRMRPPRWKLAAAKLALRLCPGLRFSTGINMAMLSRDTAFLTQAMEPGLRIRVMSARMFDGGCRAALEILGRAREFRTPLFLFRGAEDTLTCETSTRTFFDTLPVEDKTLRIYPGMLHEVHNDWGREVPIREMIEWVELRSA